MRRPNGMPGCGRRWGWRSPPPEPAAENVPDCPAVKVQPSSVPCRRTVRPERVVGAGLVMPIATAFWSSKRAGDAVGARLGGEDIIFLRFSLRRDAGRPYETPFEVVAFAVSFMTKSGHVLHVVPRHRVIDLVGPVANERDVVHGCVVAGVRIVECPASPTVAMDGRSRTSPCTRAGSSR